MRAGDTRVSRASRRDRLESRAAVAGRARCPDERGGTRPGPPAGAAVLDASDCLRGQQSARACRGHGRNSGRRVPVSPRDRYEAAGKSITDSWTGCTLPDIARQHPSFVADGQLRPDAFDVSGAERLPDVTRRVSAVLDGRARAATEAGPSPSSATASRWR